MTKPNMNLDSAHMRIALGTARAKLIEAMDAVQKTQPHERNYFPIDEKVFIRAQQEHARRMQAINTVLFEIEELEMSYSK